MDFGRVSDEIVRQILSHCECYIHVHMRVLALVSLRMRLLSATVAAQMFAPFHCNVLFVTTYTDSQVGSMMYRFTLYDVTGEEKTRVLCSRQDITDSSLVAYGQKIFRLGGSQSHLGLMHSDGGTEMGQSNHVESFEFIESCGGDSYFKKHKLPSMQHSHRRCGSAVDKNGQLFCFGGHGSEYDLQNPLTTIIEMYTDGKWNVLNAKLPVAIWHCQTVTYGDEIFIFGLALCKNGQHNVYEGVFLCFNTSTFRFRDVQNMLTSRPWCSICSLFGRIYAIAGEGLSCNTCEVYDISANTWANLPDLSKYIHAVGTPLKRGSFSVPLLTCCSDKRRADVEVWVFMHSGDIQVFSLHEYRWRVHKERLCSAVTPKPHIYGQRNLVHDALAIPKTWRTPHTQNTKVEKAIK